MRTYYVITNPAKCSRGKLYRPAVAFNWQQVERDISGAMDLGWKNATFIRLPRKATLIGAPFSSMVSVNR